MMKLDNWQKEILEASGNVLLCTGRQVGKTTIFARKACLRMLGEAGTKIIVVSLTEDQAQLIIVMMLRYFEVHHPKLVIKSGRSRATKSRIVLRNGSQVLSRPVGNTGDSVRGFTGDVLIIDEASRMKEFIFTAAKPTLLTTGGDIWMCSTPFGKQGYFYECFLNKHGRWKVWHVSSEKVIKEREITGTWTEQVREGALQLLEDEKKDMTELQYAQEYLGLFVEDLRQFFPDELIEQCCILERSSYDSMTDYYMGCDLARLGGDESTFQIIGVKDGRKMRQVESIVKKGLLTTANEREIIGLNKMWSLNKIGIDAGAGTLGVSVLDHLLEIDDVKRKVIAMNNRSLALDREGKKTQRLFKEDLYNNLKAMLERKELYLLNDADIQLSLKSVQWEIVEGVGRVSKVKIFGKYSHIVEGLIRAAYLVKKEKNLNLWVSYV